jgi:hypothetical protein
MGYAVVVDPRAIRDIQETIDYYDSQKAGLGAEFESILNKSLFSLQTNPFFQIRYDGVHCLPLKKFPYMVHFTIDDQTGFVNP